MLVLVVVFAVDCGDGGVCVDCVGGGGGVCC